MEKAKPSFWKTPSVIVFFAGLILLIAVGQRHSFGLYLPPMTVDLGWSRETFSLAIALQNLVWGLTQPLTGMVADKYGTAKVAALGAVCYALGLYFMAHSTSSIDLWLSAGVLIGLGLSGTGFAIVYGVVGRTVAEEKRTRALGIVGAMGSFGQFGMLPLNHGLISILGWMSALIALSFVAALMFPMSAALAEDSATQYSGSRKQSLRGALGEAFTHSGFWLLTIGFFTCGFQLIFIVTHLPAYLIDQNVSPTVGMTALALIGLFNVFGTYLCGHLGDRYRKQYLLSGLYFLRGCAIALFIALPITPASIYIFSAVMGLLWLGTVPLTNGLVSQIFGVQYVATLFGFVFLSHQLGSFLGAWIGGYVFDASGSYTLMWVISIGLSLVAAIVNWPIDDRRVARLQPSG
jgi:MFS family permease